MWRARAIAGIVSVNRVVRPPASGESTGLATTNRSCSVSAGLPGNSDIVWPSLPIPSSTRSNTGGVPSAEISACSYDAAATAGSCSPASRCTRVSASGSIRCCIAMP